ncbi:unnamed protein product [Rotaria magnacalcarata]|uniref:Uncharacterized protein n=1 Tax=Rotaria magnacalcarata TaxID=392030 RepID=A0A8S3EBQ0_9BILA|nr:unnamed protein product [Rotaria magnacalcarata]
MSDDTIRHHADGHRRHSLVLSLHSGNVNKRINIFAESGTSYSSPSCSLHYLFTYFVCRYRAYFSRVTRERRTKGNEKQTTASTLVDEEEQQLQEEEDESDFDSALAATEPYDLLDDAIHVLDDMIQQQQSELALSITTSSATIPSGRTTRSGRIIG